MDMFAHCSSSRFERYASTGVARGVRRCGLMERAKKTLQCGAPCCRVLHDRAQQTLAGKPSDDRPGPAEHGAGNADTKRHWHGYGQSP